MAWERPATQKEVNAAVTRFILEKSREGIECTASAVRNKGRGFIGEATLTTGERFQIEVTSGNVVITPQRLPSAPAEALKLAFDAPSMHTSNIGPTTLSSGSAPFSHCLNRRRVK